MAWFFWLGTRDARKGKMSGWAAAYLSGYAEAKQNLLEQEKLIRRINSIIRKNGQKSRVLTDD